MGSRRPRPSPRPGRTGQSGKVVHGWPGRRRRAHLPLCAAQDVAGDIAVHCARNERAWWQAAGIDPTLWKRPVLIEGRIEPEPISRNCGLRCEPS
jgi:hypothetical protein